jgi:hypothetical protein
MTAATPPVPENTPETNDLVGTGPVKGSVEALDASIELTLRDQDQQVLSWSSDPTLKQVLPHLKRLLRARLKGSLLRRVAFDVDDADHLTLLLIFSTSADAESSKALVRRTLEDVFADHHDGHR